MFCGKTNLGKLEKLQERALSTIFLREVTQLQWAIEEEWLVIGENESNALFDNWSF